MLLYNSLSGRKEEFIPNEEGKVKLYTCGPTVYDYSHIGNFRSYVMEDILDKSLRYLGYDVIRAMNITDVGHLQSDADEGEDKMLIGAAREHKSVLDIAKFYTEAFKRDCGRLHLRWPEIVVPATQCIDVYIEIISKLMDTGYAYFSGGNVYFDTSKLDNYNVFSSQAANDMIVGARNDVTEDANKRNAQDFVLWFTKSKFQNQALKWDSPWGVGYPGWHIECSGINYKYLGEYLDIHCGGVDNKFPHHTNEIAQSESFLGHKWCNYWFHVAHLNLKGVKMGKSKGNIITLDKLEEMGYSPEMYKFLCLQSHYRNNLVFSEETMETTKKAYLALTKKINSLNPEEGDLNQEAITKYQDNFKECLANDLNTSSALTVLMDVVKSKENDATKAFLLRDFDQVFGLDLDKYLVKENTKDNQDEELVKYIELKIKERILAKKQKDYKLADEIRNELLENGITLIDTKDGTEYKIEEKNVLKRK